MVKLTSRARCLIVGASSDDLALLADLEAAGLEAVGPFGSCSPAIVWLAENSPDCAVIDPVVDTSGSQALVQVLRTRGIPFVVVSRDKRPEDALPELRSVPWFVRSTARAEFLASLDYLKATHSA